VALKATVDGTALINTTSHHLDDVVERQLQFGSQFTDQRLFHWREAGLQCLWRVRMVADRSAATPSADRGLADAEFGRQIRNRRLALLDVGSDLRRRDGVWAWKLSSLTQGAPDVTMPLATPIPSKQSPGTKHL
jgi:hypothetical protein